MNMYVCVCWCRASGEEEGLVQYGFNMYVSWYVYVCVLVPPCRASGEEEGLVRPSTLIRLYSVRLYWVPIVINYVQ